MREGLYPRQTKTRNQTELLITYELKGMHGIISDTLALRTTWMYLNLWSFARRKGCSRRSNQGARLDKHSTAFVHGKAFLYETD